MQPAARRRTRQISVQPAPERVQHRLFVSPPIFHPLMRLSLFLQPPFTAVQLTDEQDGLCRLRIFVDTVPPYFLITVCFLDY